MPAHKTTTMHSQSLSNHDSGLREIRPRRENLTACKKLQLHTKAHAVLTLTLTHTHAHTAHAQKVTTHSQLEKINSRFRTSATSSTTQLSSLKQFSSIRNHMSSLHTQHSPHRRKHHACTRQFDNLATFVEASRKRPARVQN